MADRQGGHRYNTPTWWKHLVAEYTGLSFLQVGELNYIEFLQYRRDAFIAMLSKTEKGQEYLDNAWRMEQTEPDRDALRRKLSKGGA
jgi:hypothetical protein